MTHVELLEEELQKLEVKYISMILEYRKEKRLIFDKAKETLYTEEQVREAIELGREIDYNGTNDYTYSDNEIIQSLKQPKKD